MKYINKALRRLIAVNGLFLFGAMLFAPIHAVFIQKIGGIILIGVSAAAYYISASFFLWIVGRLGDKVKEKELLLAASYLIRSAGYLGFLFVNSPLTLLLLQVFFGLAEALGTPSFGAIFAKHLDGKMEVMEYSDWALVSNLIAALGALIGGYFVSSLGFGVLFVAISIMCFISFLGIYLSPRKLL